MCGISCIVSKRGEVIDRKDIQLMSDLVKHRGPDGEGFYHYQNLGLGHRRLSIIDLSEAGNQPMAWKDEIFITYNGEVYNYLEIRRELEKEGYNFKSRSDTEVILAAYHFWGTDCLSRFNGMWAIVIFDKRKNILFCSRDRFGVKPFYYLDSTVGFYAGSEIKQLLPFVKNRKIFAPALSDYLLLNASDHTTDTFFEEIKNLRGGHYLIYNLNTNKYTITKWFTPEFHENVNKLSEVDTIDVFTTEFERAIKWRMRSDVKVGVCLSGGLDSSYIAAISALQYNAGAFGENFQAVTARSIDKVNDETAYAKMVVDRYQLGWNITTPERKDFNEALDTVVAVQEEPFSTMSVYMQYFAMKKARDAGIKVLLDGQGADESLLGYPRYFINYLNLKRFTQKPGMIRDMMNKYDMSIKSVFMNFAYFSYPSVRWKRQTFRVPGLQKKLVDACRKDYYFRYDRFDKKEGLRQLQLMEMCEITLPLLLRYEDKNSMHFSIETRLPFLDWQLMEMIYSMNDNYRFKGGWSKYILRKSLEKTVPHEIAWRKKKIGFAAPSNAWLSNRQAYETEVKKSSFINEVFDKKIPNLKGDDILWKLFSLHKWIQQSGAYL